MYATVPFPVDVNLMLTGLLSSGVRSLIIMPRSSSWSMLAMAVGRVTLRFLANWILEIGPLAPMI